MDVKVVVVSIVTVIAIGWFILSINHGIFCALDYIVFDKGPISLITSKCTTSAILSIKTTPPISPYEVYELATLACEENDQYIFDIILSGGVYPYCELNGTTILHTCARSGCLKCCVTIVEKGICEVNILDEVGKRAFDITSSERVASYLLDIEEKNKKY
jgi:hypothetical protein